MITVKPIRQVAKKKQIFSPDLVRYVLLYWPKISQHLSEYISMNLFMKEAQHRRPCMIDMYMRDEIVRHSV